MLVTLCAQVGFQVYAGMQKSQRVPIVADSLSRAHTQAGMPVVALLACVSVLGYFSLFNKPDPAENDINTAIIGSFMLVLATGLAWYVSSPAFRALAAASESVPPSKAPAVAYELVPPRDRSGSPRQRTVPQ